MHTVLQTNRTNATIGFIFDIIFGMRSSKEKTLLKNVNRNALFLARVLCLIIHANIDFMVFNAILT